MPQRNVAAQVEWLETFLRHSHRRQYPSKTTIIHHGDQPDTLYYIVEGSVSVVVEDDDGREIVLAYLNKGDFFGEMGLFDDDSNRSAWVVARTKCELAEINYEQFRRLAKQEPEILFALTSQITNRLRKTSTKVKDLAFLDVTRAEGLRRTRHDPRARQDHGDLRHTLEEIQKHNHLPQRCGNKPAPAPALLWEK